MQNTSKEAMAMELQEIIAADRKASEIIDQAKDACKTIEKETAQQAAAILSGVENARAKMEKQVASEQEETLASRVAELKHQFAQRKKALESRVEQNREQWVCAIVARITAQGEQA